jgi:hypothetical protein
MRLNKLYCVAVVMEFDYGFQLLVQRPVWKVVYSVNK